MALPASVKAWDVAVVGEIYADHIFSGFESWPAPGEEVLAKHYLRELGGGAVNTACGLGRLGRRTRLLGMIGADDRAWFERRLGEFGVDAGGLRTNAAGTGVSLSVSTREDRSFFTYLGANQALGALLEQDEVLAELGSARHVHFAMPLSRAQAQALLPALKAAGCSTSLDVGFQPAWLADASQRSTCQQVDFILPNQKEAALLCGGDSTEAFAAWARALDLPHGVFKLGAAGALIVDAEGARLIAPPNVRAVDTTGAGDAFDAGLIDAWLYGLPIDTCLRRACVCGALCATTAGALAGLPDFHLLRSTYERSYGA